MPLNTNAINMQDILDVVVAFSSEKDYFKLLDLILSKMCVITNCDAGTLYTLDDEQLHFRILHNDTLNVHKNDETDIGLPPIKLDAKNIKNVSAYCAIKNEMVNVPDVYSDLRFNFEGPKNYDKYTGYKTSSMLVFPLANAENQVVGVLQLMNAKDANGNLIPFVQEFEFYLGALSNIAAVALTNIAYTEEIRDLFYSFVKIMSKAVDERSHYNGNHTNMVAGYCGDFVDYLEERFGADNKYGVLGRHKEQLVMAAYLHDIGKVVTPLEVMDKGTRLGDRASRLEMLFALKKAQLEVSFLRGAICEEAYRVELAGVCETAELVARVNPAGYVPAEIMDKLKSYYAMTYTDDRGEQVRIFEQEDIDCLGIMRGTLTKEEMCVMQNHVVITAKLLDNISFNKQYQDVPVWASCHHEFLDGSGYPNHYANGEIPLEVCILTISDIFDALSARDRPYKKAVPYDKSCEILCDMAREGKLHAELVELFIESKIWEKYEISAGWAHGE